MLQAGNTGASRYSTPCCSNPGDMSHHKSPTQALGAFHTAGCDLLPAALRVAATALPGDRAPCHHQDSGGPWISMTT
jgi:hypothetical protein